MSVTNTMGATEDAIIGDVDLGGLNHHLGFVLRFAQLAVFKDISASLKPFDLRPGQYAVLKVIAANPGLSQGRLGILLNIKKPNLAALMSEFEARGLVSKERRVGDGRLRMLSLTPAGTDLMADVDAAYLAHRARLEAMIPPDEQAILIEMLQRLYASGLGDEPGFVTPDETDAE